LPKIQKCLRKKKREELPKDNIREENISEASATISTNIVPIVLNKSKQWSTRKERKFLEKKTENVAKKGEKKKGRNMCEMFLFKLDNPT
jgi:hypothetical protein